MSAYYTIVHEDMNNGIVLVSCNYIWSEDAPEKFQTALSSADIMIIKNFEQRKLFTRFRLSAHILRIELGRCQGIVCLYCSSADVEDEIHYLLNCDKFKDERSNLFYIFGLSQLHSITEYRKINLDDEQ